MDRTAQPSASLPFRAVIMDLDRTLLRTDKSVSDYTLSVLEKWQRAGAFLYAATARPERAISDYRRIIDFRSVTTLNGARTVTPAGVFDNPILPADASSLLEQLSRMEGAVISAETESGLYANREITVWQPVVLEDIRKLPECSRVYKVLASHPDIPADQLRVTLPENVYCTVADRKLMQFMSRSATKWAGIRRMLEEDQIPADRAVFFGDDNDDIEPLRRCGRGVAVSNALPCVKEAADAVTLSNDEDGVAAYLDSLF